MVAPYLLFDGLAVFADKLANDVVRRYVSVDGLKAGKVAGIEEDMVAFELIRHFADYPRPLAALVTAANV